MNNLNKKQQEAAMHKEGPLLILAGAGSGKTSTMTHRIAHLIREEGVAPYNILAVTFTNKAANEMRERVETLLGGPAQMWILTFHAACLRILRKHAHVLGYTNSFIVYDTVDTKTIVKNIMKEYKIDEKQFKAQAFLGQISECKEKEISPEMYRSFNADNYRSQITYKVYREYESRLKKNNAMDFDDLLLNVVKIFKDDDNILMEYQQRFKYVMVDEYQDTNNLQYKFIKMLGQEHQNVCVVGDDDQCIYQWRGADITNILNFERDFKEAKVVKLEQNYRSTGNILEAAHSVIEHNSQRKDKKLWTDSEAGHKIVYCRADNEKEEAYYIAQEISRIKNLDSGKSYKDFAILYRTNAQSRTFEEGLSARGIPYRVVGGIRYYERKEIKDIVAYMRLVENPKDDLSFMRVINTPKRGIGNTTQERLQELANARGESVFEVLLDEEIVNGLSAKARTSLKDMMAALLRFNEEKENLRVSDIYDGLLTETGYMRDLEKTNTVEAESRLENLLEFKSVIYSYEEEGDLQMVDFLEKIALLSDIDNHDTSEDAVTLMTMHSAKGLEFPVVFLPGMEDGLFPGWRAMEATEGLEEERRLCYVGMTRAKERLCLTSAAYRTLYGKGSYTRESTFLRELDPKLIDGDGIFDSKKDAKFGEHKNIDGYGKAEGYKPFNNLLAAKKEIKEKVRHNETFNKGDEVSHGKFGKGMVVSVSGNVVEIMFDSAGLKKLAADMAPIRKI